MILNIHRMNKRFEFVSKTVNNSCLRQSGAGLKKICKYYSLLNLSLDGTVIEWRLSIVGRGAGIVAVYL